MADYQVDIVIVGAGVIGLSAALALAPTKLNIVVLDAQPCRETVQKIFMAGNFGEGCSRFNFTKTDTSSSQSKSQRSGNSLDFEGRIHEDAEICVASFPG